MNELQNIIEEYQKYNKEEITQDEALEILKSLPPTFNQVIIDKDEEAFRSMLRAYLPYQGMNSDYKFKRQRAVFGQYLQQKLIEKKMTYRDLAKLSGVSETTVYYFINNHESISIVHFQKILEVFGLAIDFTTELLFAEKYLQIVEDSTPPTDEDINGPSIPMTPLEPSIKPDVPLTPLEPSTPGEPEIPLTPLDPATPVTPPEGGDGNEETENQPPKEEGDGSTDVPEPPTTEEPGESETETPE